MPRKPILTMLSTAAMTALAAMSLPITTVVAAPAADEAKAAARNKFTNSAYIVQLAEKPVTAYTGGIKGLQATKPRKGQKIDPNSPAVVNYRSFLESRQEAVLASVGGGKKLHSYGYVFNGFAAELTAEQAAKLAQTNGVVRRHEGRSPHARHRVDAGFSRPDGAGWRLVADPGRRRHHRHRRRRRLAGEPSFSDRTGVNGNATRDGKLSYQQIPGWNGRCVPGEAVQCLELQPEADRCALLQRGLGRQRRHRRPAPLGIQLAA